MAVFGIHIGNSSVSLAVCKATDGDNTRFCVEVLANNAGERVTPAIVTVTENENIVGTACKSLMNTRWNTTIVCNKRLMDSTIEEPPNGTRRVPTVLKGNELYYELPLNSTTEYITPANIARCFFRNLFAIAKDAMPDAEETNCVLIVPKNMSQKAIFKLRAGAEAEGWDVIHIISEPAAAVLGYNLLNDPTPRIMLVYRVGGKSCDATVCVVENGMVAATDSEYTEDVGGFVFIKTLTKHLADEFFRKYKLDPRMSYRSLTKLTLAAEDCLHVLSTIESATCFIESLCEGVDFSHQMSRARFESLLNLASFAKPILTVLERQNMTPNDISTVCLVGGAMKVPKLRNFISSIFQEAHTKIAPLPNGVNYDEVLACGAARHAGHIASHGGMGEFLPDQTEVPTLVAPVTVKVDGAVFDDLELESGLPLPLQRHITVSQPQEIVTVILKQESSQNTQLRGQIQLKNLPNPCTLVLEIDCDDGATILIPDETSETGMTRQYVELFPAELFAQ